MDYMFINGVKNYFITLVESASRQNRKNILSLCDVNSKAKIIDLGCDTGEWSLELANKIKTNDIEGMDIVPNSLKAARKLGIKVVSHDLNKVFPFKNNYFDVIHANQVIEHLYKTDIFISEIYRTLKKGGYALISTENLSSWHNIGALFLGLQPFSMQNFSDKGNIGNPLTLHGGSVISDDRQKAHQHNRLFSYFALKDIFQKHGFIVEKMVTAGYYPFSNILTKIDPYHGHWITLKIRKPA
jgi:2-polyprenyl-3-methyl-5-hydroxy-6-metoxy-1,4-benzoquinol methylase